MQRFLDIMRGYKLLLKSGIKAGFCCTISKGNVERLKEVAVWFTEQFDLESMGFNIMIENSFAKDMRGDNGDIGCYAEKTADSIIECFRFFRERGIYEDRVMRKVNTFIKGQIYYYDCGGCGQQIVVSPDGMVGVCQGYCGTKNNFVSLDEAFNPLDHFLWDEWRQRSPLLMPQCRQCIALSTCGGGCPYGADLRHGSIWELDEVFCVHAKKTIEFLIKETISNCVNQ